MKLYQVSYQADDHKGYAWFSNKKEALANKRQEQSEECEVEIFEHDIKLTKAGVLKFLNVHASYPDNG